MSTLDKRKRHDINARDKDPRTKPPTLEEQTVPKRLFCLLMLLCLLASAVTVVPGFAAPSAKQNRVALVIGNSAYDSVPLKNPANDAKAMANVLRDLGFEVIHLENASQAVMEDAVNAMGRQLDKGGVGLFYFAGHGVQSEGRNFLIPVQAQFSQESDLPRKAVDASWVLERMEKANNELNIVILDACRNNPFAKRFRSMGAQGGLASMDAPKGSLIAFATSPGSVASDGAGANGVYTKHLLENLRTPGLELEQMFKRVRRGVISETGSRQRPWETTSVLGDFVFASSGDQAASNQGKSAVTPVAAVQRPGAKNRSSAIQVEFAMMRENGKNAPTPVQTGDTLKSDDGYFFHIKPSADCYLYLFQVDSTGTVFRLYPNDKYRSAHNPTPAKARMTLPNDNNVFYLDNTVGKEEFYFLASYDALPQLEQLDGGSVDGIMRAGVSLRGPAGVRAVATKVVTSSSGETKSHVQEFSFSQSFVHAISINHK